jgi:AbrB family looped-hinge helix DNA binding protein
MVSNSVMNIDAEVNSKGQITLPKDLRERFGILRGGRVRFTISADGSVTIERALNEIEDLWRMADSYKKSGGVMSFEEMNEAKAIRGEGAKH